MNHTTNQTTDIIPEHVLGLVDTLSYRDNDLQDYLNNICEGLIDLLGDGLAAVTLYQNNQKHILSIIPGKVDPDKGLNIKGVRALYKWNSIYYIV